MDNITVQPTNKNFKCKTTLTSSQKIPFHQPEKKNT